MSDRFDEFLDDNNSNNFEGGLDENSYDIFQENDDGPSYNTRDNQKNDVVNDNLATGDDANTDIIEPLIKKSENDSPFIVTTNLENNNQQATPPNNLFSINNDQIINNAIDSTNDKSRDNQKISPNSFRRKKLFIGIVIVLSLLCVSAGTIYATEMGAKTGLDKIYNMVGLEKLWGGLPNDGKLALAEAVINMAEIKSAHFENLTNIEATFDYGGNSSLQTFLKNKASFALQSSGEGRVLGTDSNDNASPKQNIKINIKASGDYQKDKIQAKVTIDTPLLNDGLSFYNLKTPDSDSLDINFRLIDDKSYIRIPLIFDDDKSKEAKWLEFSKNDTNSYLKMYTNNDNKEPNKLWDYYSLIKSSRKIGTEDVNGHQTVKYESDIDTDKLMIMLNGNNQVKSEIVNYKPEMTLYYWIGKDDRYIHKFAASINSEAQNSSIKTNFEVTLSKYNRTFNVEAPELKDIEVGGISAIIDNSANDQAIDN